MANLAVTPQALGKLATTQDQAANQAGTAAAAASNLEVQVWVSHGIVSGFSNVAFTKAEAARRAVGEAMKNSSTELAEKLRNAKAVYQSTDESTSQNLDKQVVDR
jgi:hypothetical protein